MGNWFASFIGYWFGGSPIVPPVTEPDPVCNPTITVVRDLYTVVPQQELVMSFSIDAYTYTIEDC